MNVVAEPLVVNEANKWRLETPGSEGWARSPRAGAARKYYICSMDSHIMPPLELGQRLKPEHQAMMPRVEVRDGTKFLILEGRLPMRLVDAQMEGEDYYRQKAGSVGVDTVEQDMAIRLADMDRDGIDFELAFPNGWALSTYNSGDFDFTLSVLRIYNDWATEMNCVYGHRVRIAPCVSSHNVDDVIVELQRLAKLGHNTVHLPTHPDPMNRKVNYNQDMFKPLWSAIEDLDLSILFHVSTGGDPRRARGRGGAIMNRQLSHEMMADVITFFCASGVLDDHPKLRFACVEGGGGWVPALLDLMDETYLKHHMFIRPKLKHGMPSEYFRQHGLISFQEDRSAMILCEPYNLTSNFSWSSDYPHQEGTFPHSAEAIEREFGGVSEETRTKILGLNGARFLKLDVPRQFLD